MVLLVLWSKVLVVVPKCSDPVTDNGAFGGISKGSLNVALADGLSQNSMNVLDEISNLLVFKTLGDSLFNLDYLQPQDMFGLFPERSNLTALLDSTPSDKQKPLFCVFVLDHTITDSPPGLGLGDVSSPVVDAFYRGHLFVER